MNMEFDEHSVGSVLATCCQQVQDAVSIVQHRIQHAQCALR
jgi:hypothetical protein